MRLILSLLPHGSAGTVPEGNPITPIGAIIALPCGYSCSSLWLRLLLGRICGRSGCLLPAAAKGIGPAGRTKVSLRHDDGPLQVRGARHFPPKAPAGRLAIETGEGKYGQTAEGALNAPFCQNHLIYKYLDQIADKEYCADIFHGFCGKAQLQGLHLG